MITSLEHYYQKCGHKISLQEDKFCPSCGEAIPCSEAGVKHILIVEKSPAEEYREKIKDLT